MALLSDKRENDPALSRQSADSLVIDGQRYGNSAAKFWAGIIDEIGEDFPLCTLAEMTALVPGPLKRDDLFPESRFKEDLSRLLTADFEAEMRSAIAEMAVLGPPASIRVRLLADESELFCGEIPTDCADAEILPFFVTWLLEWADVPESEWNESEVTGQVNAEDTKRAVSYEIPFTVTNRHLSEGLWERTVSWKMAAPGC